MRPHPLLFPFSLLYGCGVAIRNWLFDVGILKSHKVAVPVISVGNITVGGTGKTPIVQMLAKEYLKTQSVAIVSRGYKRMTKGLIEVSDGKCVKTSVEEAGDEALQFAESLPQAIIIVDENRTRGAKYAVEKLNAELIILDDGFQHRALHRDLDIVLIDSNTSPFSTSMLPAGERREFFRSLGRANVIVLTKIHQQQGEIDILKNNIAKYSTAKIFTSSYIPVSFHNFLTTKEMVVEGLSGKKVIALCGIGKPENFRTTLLQLGLHIFSFSSFPDHYWYSLSDLEMFVSLLKKSKSEYIVTTEKDISRLSRYSEFLKNFPVLSLKMNMIIHEKEEWSNLLSPIMKH